MATYLKNELNIFRKYRKLFNYMKRVGDFRLVQTSVIQNIFTLETFGYICDIKISMFHWLVWKLFHS